MAIGSVSQTPVFVGSLSTSLSNTNATTGPKNTEAEAAKSSAQAPATPGRIGNLLVPSSAVGLLALASDGKPIPELGKTGLTHRQALERNLKLSAASTAEPVKPSEDRKPFTQQDVDLIKAATGYNFVVTENLLYVVDDDGNLAPDDVAGKVQQLADSLTNPHYQNAQGSEKAEQLRAIFAKYSVSIGDALPGEWLDKALDFLQTQLNQNGEVGGIALSE